MPQGGTPQWLLIVDPVDGSRNAKSGFEGCLVSIALLKYSERPTLADVTHGLLHEIVGDRIFYAEKERATVLHYRDKTGEPSLSSNEDMSLLRWSLTVPGRPASLVFNLMADLIDVSSVTGGFFSCNSTCYSISRLLTGQQDAYIDIADRLAKEFPAAVTELYEKSGTRIWGFSSYDIAAAYLIAKQAGVVITDAYGCSLDDMELLDASPGNVRSCVAASNESLHVKLLEYIDEHIRKFQPRGG
jgi:myo-inositol-1(or 4)-monophosphatase